MAFARLLAPVIYLLYASAQAWSQPTCFTNYDATDYCYLHNSGAIIVGRVTALTAAKQYSLLRYEAADIEVYRVIKGPALGKNVHLSLASNCAGRIEVGKTYIFNAEDRGQPTEKFYSGHWADIDELSDAQIAEVFEGLDAVIAGKRQPALVGTVSGPDGSPLAGVKVWAKTDEKSIAVATDGDGRFNFPTLPNGNYKISVQYPKGYGPDDSQYNEPRDTDERDLGVRVMPDWPCGVRMSFKTALSARLTGKLEVERSGWQTFPYFQLVKYSPRLADDDFMAPFARESYSYLGPNNQPSPILFKFFHVEPGRYVLKTTMDRSFEPMTSLYYPGVRSIKDAKIFDIELGTVLDLDWKIPPLTAVTISGRMQLPDGTPLFGGVQIYDAVHPNVTDTFSPADRDRDDIKFTFHTFRGMPVVLCAGYDGAKNGREIHSYARLPFDVDRDRENIIVKLDRPITKGAYYWELCRKER